MENKEIEHKIIEDALTETEYNNLSSEKVVFNALKALEVNISLMHVAVRKLEEQIEELKLTQAHFIVRTDEPQTTIKKIERPDSVECGTPSKGSALKVYFDATKPEEAKKLVEDAIKIKSYANALNEETINVKK